MVVRRPLFATSSTVTQQVVLFVKFVSEVEERAVDDFTFVVTGERDVISLVNVADGGTEIFQFSVDAKAQFGQSNDHSDDQNRCGENQFSRHDKAVFVVLQAAEDVHGRVVSVSWSHGGDTKAQTTVSRDGGDKAGWLRESANAAGKGAEKGVGDDPGESRMVPGSRRTDCPIVEQVSMSKGSREEKSRRGWPARDEEVQ